MPTMQIEAEQLLNAALQMPRKELQQFVARLFALKAREETPVVLAQREAELLLRINQQLPSETQARLDELIKKRQAEVINPDELDELRRFTASIENADAERLECLIELAHLRNVPLKKLIRQLGLKPVLHD